ncbi:MAG TPA: hypothetical protein VHA52_04485 [Candidatus Babeliaceae bacterium]|nr:hypothetical protein [Candidatus Babeliaceae bacterium]
MKTITVSTDVYKFDELSDEAKQVAIQGYREGSQDFDFAAEHILDDFKEIGKIIGIDIDNIYFSGFYSQGDGACFEGDYRYKKNSVKDITTFAPLDKELQAIAFNLYALQRKNFFQLCAFVKHRGHYYHEMCTEITVGTLNDDRYISGDTGDELKDILRDYMRYMYKRLEEANDYVNTDAAIIESIQINEYDFTEDGSMF